MKLVLLFFLIASSEALRILLVFPVPVRSLNILGEGYVRHLRNAGHEITYATVYPIKEEPTAFFRQIDLSANLEAIKGDNVLNISNVMGNHVALNDIWHIQQLGINFARPTLENEEFRKLLEDTNEKFDVVISEILETEIYAGLAALYSCPMIWAYSMGAHWHVLKLVDETSSPAYTTNHLSLNNPPFTLSQRIQEFWSQILWMLLKRFSTASKEEEMFEKYFASLFAKRGKALPKYEDIVYNASLMFSNDHHATGNMPATPHNFKFIGGFHIENPPKALPKELQNVMDNSKHGVIYFSMGSAWQSKDILEPIITGLLKVFTELKEMVVWKFEGNILEVPKNVYILKWAPQQSILAHPNCKLFITHGGILSSTETLHFGVPSIVVPIYYDQFLNANKAVANGYAIKVDLDFNLPNNLKSAIDTMLTSPKYHQKVKELSFIYHHRPVSPGAEMVHWVEHVVKTRGALHLRSPALHVPWYQKMYLDLIVIMITVSIAIHKSICNVLE